MANYSRNEPVIHYDNFFSIIMLKDFTSFCFSLYVRKRHTMFIIIILVYCNTDIIASIFI